MSIPFNQPYMTGNELAYIKEAHANQHLAGNGPFTQRCQEWLKDHVGCTETFLTHSGTAALEIAALLCDITAGDEIIMPSYTFVSTANAFILRGGIPVFVDIRPDTLNIDETKIEAAITSKTKVIIPVHYAGVGCEMDAIMAIAQKHNLLVIEDAAHGIMSTYRNRPLGSIGHMAALSFHETKNIISGEGGALIINDERFCKRAHIVIDKGTNRNLFEEGKIDKYSWIDIGSSYRPNEITAAFLWAQLECAKDITSKRLAIWNIYHKKLSETTLQKNTKLPFIPEHCTHNAHMYYVLLQDEHHRNAFIGKLTEKGIAAVFHYVPLHSSVAGKKYGRCHGNLSNTETISKRVARLPLWAGIEKHQQYVLEHVTESMQRTNT